MNYDRGVKSTAHNSQSYPVIKGYFLFSRVQKTPDELYEWRDWFSRNGIESCIVKVHNGYILYREGTQVLQKGVDNVL